MYTTKVLLPILPEASKELYFRAYFKFFKSSSTLYLVYPVKSESLCKQEANWHVIHVFYSSCQQTKILKQAYNFIELCEDNNPKIKKLMIDNEDVDIKNCVVMLYDSDLIANSEAICDSSDKFSKLQTLVENDCIHQTHEIGYCQPGVDKPHWLLSSMLAQHVVNYANIIKWLVYSVQHEKRVKLKQGNLILAICLDLVLGYLLLELVIKDKTELKITLMSLLERLFNSLNSLLKWLMGAPAGLKLNNAFNKMLGKYFSYHIQLWWLFLEVSGEKLEIILYIYDYVGYLGFTFQAAIISDVICIATFHSYCIYVYAARLFNIQISGLIALLRLFVGRKFNPLRRGIDSCEYTNQELFVGTVAFTILLLLLPTTAMYYTVFTLFRLLSLVAQYVLAKSIYLVQTIPLYVTFLWAVKSSKVAGNILIDVVDTSTGQLTLKVNLFSKSIHELVKRFKPPVKMLKKVELSNLLTNIFTGKEII